MESALEQFKTAIQQRLKEETFVKITMGNYKGTEELKNIYIKKVIIKDKPLLSFTYRYKTRDILKNYDFESAWEQILSYFGPKKFRMATLFSLTFDEEIMFGNKNTAVFKQRKPSQTQLPSIAHDKVKQRKIEPGDKSFLRALQITDASGNVYKSAQDKFKQINHYIEILSTLLHDLPNDLRVADMGSGKGYLTFALYDYLTSVLHKKASVTGVEFRQDMVDLCNNLAVESEFSNLKFEKGAIADYTNEAVNVLIALHACDTATDDAIAIGIKNNADLIVVAPCCHKQIRRAMTEGKPNELLDFKIKYGLFLEREAELLTDSLRLMILEYHGYQTKAIDFVSDHHTPKNVLLIAKKKANFIQELEEQFLEKLKAIKTFWGIDFHYLEQKLGL